MATDPKEVATGIGRLSYAHLHEPHRNKEGDKLKYSTKFVFPKTDKAMYNSLIAGFVAALEDGVTKKCFKDVVLNNYKNKKILPAKFNMPIVDGDAYNEERENAGNTSDANLEGMYFFNAKSDRKPLLLRLENKKGKTVKTEITDKDKTLVYSGANARVGISFYPYATEGGVGVGVALNVVMVTGGGEALAGGGDPSRFFADIPSDEDDTFNDDDEDISNLE